jgi:cytochrome P450
MEGRLQERKEAPRDDYLTALTRGQIYGQPVDADLVTGIMSAFMLGGHHSTATAIAALLGHVLPKRALCEQILTDDDMLGRVIEESLRLTTPLSLFARTVRADAEVGGVNFDHGDRIMINLAAANRDPRVFARPETFDTSRAKISHVAFGRGLHTCTGQHLARAEMRITVRVLLDRLPDIRIAGEVKETGLTGGMMIQVSSLPVAFTPEQR